MTQNLPPLNALRAFEVAARHQSFKQAAQELRVTPAAISQHIKGLEQHLGTALFHRLNRTIELTSAGRSLFPALRDAFERIAEATAALAADETTGPLTISVLPSFAAQWLVPRLGRFREHNPEIDVRISATRHVIDFAREEVDLAIRHGMGSWPGLHIDWLMSGDLFPVCSPALLSGDHPLREPAELRHHVLLHNTEHREWELWFEMLRIEGVDTTRGPSFSDNTLVLRAAVEAQGVALSRSALVTEELKSGQLVKPFDVTMPSELAYYAVCPSGSEHRPKIAAFRKWLLSEAKSYAAF